jgi:hypothetical protein
VSADTLTTAMLPARSEVQHYPMAAGVLYFGVVAIPAGIFYLGLSSSNSVGMCLVAMLLLLLPQPHVGEAVGMPAIRPLQCQRVVALILLLVALHLALAAIFEPIDVPRAVGSFPLILLLLFGGGILANAFMACPPAALHQGLLRAFFLLCAIALISWTGWFVPPSLAPPWHVPVFPFSEPSVFALAFIPALMYASVATHGTARLAFIAFGLACAVLIQNLTLAVGCMMVAAVSFRVATLAVLSLPLVYFLARLDLSYFLERVDFSGDVQNLSNLFYVQGWQMFVEALQRSQGVGVGFQQMGMHGTEVPVAEILRDLYQGEDVNVLGTLFVFARVGSEFGIVGIVLTLLFIGLVVKSALALRRVAIHGKVEPPVVTLARCVVVSYTVEMFMRSPGYFTGTALLLVASLWILRQWSRAVR